MASLLTLLSGSTPEAWLLAVDALAAFLVTLAAATPTTRDDGVVGRVANVWRVLRGR